MGQVKATKKNKTRAQLASCPHGNYRGRVVGVGWRGRGRGAYSQLKVVRGAWGVEARKP